MKVNKLFHFLKDMFAKLSDDESFTSKTRITVSFLFTHTALKRLKTGNNREETFNGKHEDYIKWLKILRVVRSPLRPFLSFLFPFSDQILELWLLFVSHESTWSHMHSKRGRYLSPVISCIKLVWIWFIRFNSCDHSGCFSIYPFLFSEIPYFTKNRSG